LSTHNLSITIGNHGNVTIIQVNKLEKGRVYTQCAHKNVSDKNIFDQEVSIFSCMIAYLFLMTKRRTLAQGFGFARATGSSVRHKCGVVVQSHIKSSMRRVPPLVRSSANMRQGPYEISMRIVESGDGISFFNVPSPARKFWPRCISWRRNRI